MSLAALLSPPQLARLADEVDPLLERLRQSSLRASRALEGGNLLELVRAMQERERLFLRTAPLLDELRVRAKVAGESEPAGSAAAGEIAAAVSRVLETLRGIEASDAALRAEVDRLGTFAAGELRQVRRQRTVRAGYAEAKRTGTNVDLRR